MKTISIECPDDLAEELAEYVREGWARNSDEVVVTGLRRYLYSHRPELQEAQLLNDVRWGLQKDDE
jgi:Arc/MetJ-type ribon-helix-helix transcriptional regulator